MALFRLKSLMFAKNNFKKWWFDFVLVVCTILWFDELGEKNHRK